MHRVVPQVTTDECYPEAPIVFFSVFFLSLKDTFYDCVWWVVRQTDTTQIGVKGLGPMILSVGFIL